ncbi:hypothetical protein KX928_12850 [Roseobacter sp. YSTF-M11]|uniref:Core-binding (CB) domain-containing protein n=1 Tax=Roseobacter insulae TaxID=2859783 RepID=A0A9X1K2M2_9RHOB|nr:site-specific integrase [Roseobacter insulae]MBW4708673.1 hypothetical protein [Roseobacter insulae]
MPSPIKIGETYYLRVRVPSDITAKMNGRTIAIPIANATKTVAIRDTVKVSLQTKEAQEAKQRFVRALASVEAFWETVRKGPQPLTHKASLAIAGEIRQLWISIFDDEPGSPEFWERMIDADKQAAEGALHPLAVSTAKTKMEALEARYGAITDAFLRKKGLLVEAGSRSRLVEHVASAMSEMAEVSSRKAGGDYSDTGQTNKYPAPLEVLSPDAATDSNSHGQASVLTFNTTVDTRVSEKGSGRDAKVMPVSTVRKYRAAASEFAKYRGSEDLASITAREADGWKRSMLKEGRLSNKTIGQRLQNVRTVIEWAREQHFGELFPSGNPLDHVKRPEYLETPSEERAFTLDEARTVLRAASAQAKPYLRWIPWMCAYTGARVNEMAQLTQSSFYQVEGLWFIRVTTMGGKSLKNQHSERRVPVHADLLEQGLIEFVQNADAKGDHRLFPKRTASNVRDWIRDDLAITRSGLMPNHGWRHLFEDRAMGSGMAHAAKLYISGRSTSGSDAGYGKSEAMLPGLALEMQKFPSYLD